MDATWNFNSVYGFDVYAYLGNILDLLFVILCRCINISEHGFNDCNNTIISQHLHNVNLQQLFYIRL